MNELYIIKTSIQGNAQILIHNLSNTSILCALFNLINKHTINNQWSFNCLLLKHINSRYQKKTSRRTVEREMKYSAAHLK